MAGEIIVTQTGYEKLQKELDELKGAVRMRIAEAIREAKSHGDLKENAAYHEAKLNQQRNEARIADLEKALQLAKIVDKKEGSGEEAQLGSKVKLKDMKFGDELRVELVGSFEADPANDLFSITSPLGSALLGKAAGQEVEVDAPAGKQHYKILAVE